MRYRALKGNPVICQVISCDICGAEKGQTNHWFVCYEQSGELRVGGWNSRHLLCPGTKQLCGESCLHKLVSEFLAKSLPARTTHSAASADVQPANAAEIGVPTETPSFQHSITPAASSSPRSSYFIPRAYERRSRSHRGTERRTS